jgi:hypothetical protein
VEKRLFVGSVVEGRGEVSAMRLLLTRVAAEMFGYHQLEVLPPVLVKRNQMLRPAVLDRSITLARLKLDAAAAVGDGRLVLVLLDADDDLPCVIAPQIMKSGTRDDVDVTCVVANREYETWFVAAAASLTEYLDVPTAQQWPSDVEAAGLKKAWIERHFRGHYSPSVDQAKLTARMDLEMCRGGSPSFDKLCRELGSRIPPPVATAGTPVEP